MTKAKAIKELTKMGWTLINTRKGQSSVELAPPVSESYPENWTAWASGKRVVVANPQDLLAEIQGS